jgi:hypothetical protein
MNRKTIKCPVSGFLDSLIATEKSGYPLRFSMEGMKE